MRRGIRLLLSWAVGVAPAAAAWSSPDAPRLTVGGEGRRWERNLDPSSIRGALPVILFNGSKFV